MEELRGHFNEEVENVRKNQSEMRNTITEINNTSVQIDSILVNIEGISCLDDRIVEITKSEEQSEKIILRNQDSIRDLWDNIKHSNIHGFQKKRETGRKYA